MTKCFDCVVCGEICVDLTVRPISRDEPLRGLDLVRVEPIVPHGGGIVSNSGIVMSRLGMSVAGFGCVGDDAWAELLTKLLAGENVDTHCLQKLPGTPTSATAVLVGEDSEHTFAFHPGASRRFTKQVIFSNMEVFQQSRYSLWGYYGLMPDLETDLAEVLQRVQQTGCKTALDASAGGGTIRPLDRILPYLDIYIPSFQEAKSQTGQDDPKSMITSFRHFSRAALLGVKLGAEGALLSPAADEWIEIPPVSPPGDVIDTTGAGDSFYAGFITGLAKGMTIEQAGTLAAAAGACCVTGVGAVSGILNFPQTAQLAGL